MVTFDEFINAVIPWLLWIIAILYLGYLLRAPLGKAWEFIQFLISKKPERGGIEDMEVPEIMYE